jgi:hypothetical protein
MMFVWTSYAQIPNPGFENWTDGDPDGWSTYDVLWNSVTQSADAHSGSYAVRLEIIDFMGSPMPPILEANFPVTERFSSLTGYYKFIPIDDEDIFSINIFLFYGSSIWEIAGSGILEIANTAESYTKFTVPIEYFTEDTPVSAWLIFLIELGSDNEAPGSYVLLDDLSLNQGPVTSVEDAGHLPLAFNLNQNYPNPFNPSTEIAFTIPSESYVELKIYDMLGKEVATLASDTFSPGNYTRTFTAVHLPSGIYIARLNIVSIDNGIMKSNSVKMTLLK